MRVRSSWKALTAASWLVVALLLASGSAVGQQKSAPVNGHKTPLDEYVAKTDSTYEWKVVKTVPGDGVTTFIVDMKSQTWRSVPEVDRPVWQHWLIIVKPDRVDHETGFLMIGGGRNGGPPPDGANVQTLLMAKATNSVAAELRMIPNQPLVLNNDGKQRSEDDLLAYGWTKFMDTKDPTWIPRFAMVKATVRAMDTITALLASPEGGKTTVDKFVIAGGSKRGWTTWLTGAVDKRVVAIVPIVIDVVNVRDCCINHFCAYGFWAPAIGDYTRHGIQKRMDTPEHDELMRIEDPYFYRNRFTMPKFVVNACGDQYFPPDSSKFYFGDLPGEKYLRYVPNADHSLRGSDAQESILAFYQSILAKKPMPRFTWTMNGDGSILVRAQDKPTEVNLWQATNAKARDFRLMTIGKAFQATKLEGNGNGEYLAKVPKPESGWTAFLVELVYQNGDKATHKFTTPVSIVPDVLPHRLEEFQKGSE